MDFGSLQHRCPHAWSTALSNSVHINSQLWTSFSVSHITCNYFSTQRSHTPYLRASNPCSYHGYQCTVYSGNYPWCDHSELGLRDTDNRTNGNLRGILEDLTWYRIYCRQFWRNIWSAFPIRFAHNNFWDVYVLPMVVIPSDSIKNSA